MLKLQPLNDKIIVEPIEESEVTPSGIVLPQTAKEKPEKGKIIAVGPGKLLDNGKRAELSVKVGDQVIFKKYSPDEVKIDNQEYLIISEEDILAVLK
ncbi:co-chaperone GroES [candidate division WOR-3 bacterium]|nr:co-chaperone GroES [candidate division WOR-3 bacterium]